MSELDYQYPWTRLTYPHQQHNVVDRDVHGWATPSGPWQHPQVKPLAAHRDASAVIVLGERGVGKSQVLSAEHLALQAVGASSGHLTLPDVSSQRMKERIAETLAGASSGMHYAFLDALDDTTSPVDTAMMIAEGLEDLGETSRSRLRLRLACRTSRWPVSLHERLNQLHPHGVQLIGVAGLTRGQALAAAERRGLADPEEFISELESRRLVVPIAMWPVTYLPALEDAALGKPLPQTIRTAYDRACARLCTEATSEAPNGPISNQLDPREILVLSRKAAAAMQFSAHNVLSETIGDADAICLDDLAQNSEPFGDRSVPCTRGGFQQLMQSGLMVQTGQERRWAFAHRSFQEYLAAEYLLAHKTVQASIDRLLLIGTGRRSRAVTAHRDVAAWVATVNDTMFEHLLIHDPLVLLRADLRSRSDADRDRVFLTLLNMVRVGDGSIDEPYLLASLDGPSVTIRVASLLRPDAPIEELYLAIQVANECPQREFSEALLGVAEAVNTHKSLRTRALHALHHIDQPEWVARLRALAGDLDPDLAAAALRKLWPTHISTVGLLQILPIPLPNYSGMAKSFLRRIAEAIPEPDLPAAATWAACVFAEGNLSPEHRAADTRATTAEAIAIRAVTECLTHPDRESLINALVDTVLVLTDRGTHGVALDLQRAFRNDPAARRTIARAVLDRATADQILNLHGHDPVCLFSGPEDALFWARALPNLPPRVQCLFNEQLWYLSGGLPQWEEVYEIAQAHPVVRNLTRILFEWPIDHQLGQRHRALQASQVWREAERVRARFNPELFRAAVEAILVGAVNPRAGWREVVRHVHRTADGDIEPFGESLDITSAASFPQSGSPIYEKVIRAARIVLEATPIVTIDDVGPDGLNLINVPELWALSLYVGRKKSCVDLEPARWSGFAIALFCIHGHDPERTLRTSLLRVCVDHAGNEFGPALREVLSRLEATCRATALITLEDSPSEGFGGAMLDWVKDRNRTTEQWAQVLDVLITWGNQPAADILRKAAITPATRLRNANSSTVRRWTAAANILIRRGDTRAWPAIFRRVNRMPQLVEDLLKSLNEYKGPDYWQYGSAKQIGEALAELHYILLLYEPDDKALSKSNLQKSGAEINSVQLRRSLPQTIAGRADATALATFQDLEKRKKLDRILETELRRLQHLLTQSSWKPLKDVREVVIVATHRTERVVTDVIHLRDVVLESLERLQERIGDDNGWATVLWDLKYTTVTIKKKQCSSIEWKPKREQDFNDFVATFLRYDLQDRHTIVNREVEITRAGLPGDRTDIQVHAHLPDGAGSGTLTVIIESKGCWNSKLDTELNNQLVERYLRRQGPRAGIYLIGYFDDHRWEGRREHTSHSIDDILILQEALAQQAAEDYGVSVKVHVLDCRLRGHHPDNVPNADS